MGFVLEFDAKNNILRGTLDGRATDAFVLECYAAATRYTTSHPPCRGLWVVSDITSFEVSNHTIREIARKPPIIAPGYIRVVVAASDFLFGMMRMLQILAGETRPDLHVVRTMDEAYQLLRVESPEFAPVDL